MKGIRRQFYFGIRLFSNDFSYLAAQHLRQAYLCLDLDEDSEIQEVRQRYSHLVKKYHPDTGKENVS
jgi:DnaJ-class molecular chaperone